MPRPSPSIPTAGSSWPGVIPSSTDGTQGFFVERFNPDGSTDTGFGSGTDGPGIVLTPTGGAGTGVAVQPDGTIDVSGQFTTSSSDGFAVAQYLGGTETAPPGGLTAQSGADVAVAGVVPTGFGDLGSTSNEVEGQIAINPTDPDNIVAVGADESIPFGQGIRVDVSNDDGVTWSTEVIGTGAAPDNLPDAAGNNAAIAFDQFGNLFIAYLTPNPIRSGLVASYQVDVVLSTNGGASFQQLAQLGTGDAADQPKIRPDPAGPEAPGERLD